MSTEQETRLQENGGYKFKFTVIMAVYNVEDYIDEAIKSVICQTIGFKDNIQLILSDDESPDSSGAICDKYKEMYPDNVVVIHKKKRWSRICKKCRYSFGRGKIRLLYGP